MSALDFTARALALRALAHDPLTFAEAAQAGLPANVVRFDSSGHTRCGLGAGTYICDDLATAELHAAHPAAVIAGQGNRFFRLLGNSGGYITPEQLGCPASASGTDQLAWLQAAIDYAEAIPALNGVLLTQRDYEIWRDPSVPAAAEYGGGPLEGQFLVVRKPVRIIGVHPLGTTIHFKGPTGGSLLTDYSVIDGTIYGDDKVHRGHGILLYGEASVFGPQPEDEANLPALYLENITLSTGMIAERDPAWPATVANPNSWDVTNKCIASRGNYMNGKVELHNVTFDGFFGENTYLSGMRGAQNSFSKLIARRWTVKNTNATFINAHGPTVLDIDGMYAENCVSSWESWAGWVYGRIANATFTNIGGAGFHGGVDYDAERRTDDTQPLLVVENVTIQGIANGLGQAAKCYVGSFVKSRGLRLIDMELHVVGLIGAQVLKNIDLDCAIECDKQTLDGAIHLYAHPGAPVDAVENVQIRANLTRSDYARANYKSISGIKYQGWAGATYGPNVTIRVRGDQAGYMVGTLAEQYGGNLFHAGDIRPKIIDEGLHGTGTWSLFPGSSRSAFNASTTPSPEFGLTWLKATFGGTGVTAQFPVTPPAPAKFNDGHEVTIEHADDTCPDATLLVDGRITLGYGESCKLRANRCSARWDVIERPL